MVHRQHDKSRRAPRWAVVGLTTTALAAASLTATAASHADDSAELPSTADASAAAASPSKTIEIAGKKPGDHNPLLGHKFGADGFGFVDNGRVYMYMTNDTQGYAPDPDTGVSPQIDYGQITEITVISSTDMVNWTDHGEIPVAGEDGVAPFTNNSWAPGMAKKVIDGKEKYFLYYANGGGSSNVLTGDSPVGPWTSERTDTLIDHRTPGTEGVAWRFDPAPFVDDDGQAYLYFGGGPASTDMPAEERFNNPKNIRAIKLGDDMVSTEGSAVVVDTPVSFEAAQVFKRGDYYYLSYSSHFGGDDFGGAQETFPGYPGGGEIGYLMSEDPMSWPKETYAGVMFPNQSQFFGAGTGGNNHQSGFEYEGKYYFSYHAPTLNKAVNGDATQGYRSPHLQELSFNEDGTVQQVVGDYEGVEQVRDFDPYRLFEAETLGWTKGVATTAVEGGSAEFGESAPNLVVTDIDDGDWTGLSSVAFGDDGAASVTARVKPAQAGGSIDVRLDAPDGPVVGTIDVDGTAGDWQDVTAQLDGAVGTHDVYFSFTGPDGDLFEIDTFEFHAADDADPTLTLSVEASPRCVAGKTVLVAQATNEADVAADVTVASPFGTKTFEGLEPGATTSHAFSTRSSDVPAGEITAEGTAAVDGSVRTGTASAPYDAADCG